MAMKLACILFVFVIDSSIFRATALKERAKKPGNALAKVRTLLKNLKKQIQEETVRELEQNEEYLDYCGETNSSAEADLARAQAVYEAAQADITDALYNLNVTKAELDKVANKIATRSSELQDAKDTRLVQEEDYRYARKTLTEAIANLGQAQTIISQEMAKTSGRGLLQVDPKKWSTLVGLVQTAMNALSLQVDDKQTLTALIQSSSSFSMENDLGYRHATRDAPVYESSSSGILQQLEFMEKNAKKLLFEVEQAEIKARSDHAALIDKLTAEIDGYEHEKLDLESDKQKYLKDLGEAQGRSLKAEADLAHLLNLLKELGIDCTAWKDNHKTFEKDQAEEVEALEAAQAAVEKAMGHVGDGVVGINGLTTGNVFLSEASETPAPEDSETPAPDFLQTEVQTESLSSRHTRRLVERKVLEIIRSLGRSHHENALMQLAAQVRMVVKLSSPAEDEFKKVKEMIRDMIEKLDAELAKTKSEGKFCEENMQKTKGELEALEVDIGRLDTEIEYAYTREVDLNDEKKNSEEDLAKAREENNLLNMIFNNETRIYILTVNDLKEALAAVRKAIEELTDFYGTPPSSSFAQTPLSQATDAVVMMQTTQNSTGEDVAPKTTAGHGIIGMLQIVENDLAKGLTEEETTYKKNQEKYEKQEKGFRISFAGEEKDVVFYGSEYLSAHRYTGELDAEEKAKRLQQKDVIVVYMQLKKQCDAKPGLYADKKAAREKEIEGLEKALHILSNPEEYELMQVRSRRTLRGARRLAL